MIYVFYSLILLQRVFVNSTCSTWEFAASCSQIFKQSLRFWRWFFTYTSTYWYKYIDMYQRTDTDITGSVILHSSWQIAGYNFARYLDHSRRAFYKVNARTWMVHTLWFSMYVYTCLSWGLGTLNKPAKHLIYVPIRYKDLSKLVTGFVETSDKVCCHP